MTEQEREEIMASVRDGYIEDYDRVTLDNLFKQIEKEHKEVQEYRAIGTVEECREAVLNIEHFYMLGRNKAIDEAIKASAEAICVGCGYLDGHKCTYKGANCGVSKPMLESVVKALEKTKEGEVAE